MEYASVTPLYDWDRYLVYAIVLDVAKNYSAIKHLAIKTNQNIYGVSWYYRNTGSFNHVSRDIYIIIKQYFLL